MTAPLRVVLLGPVDLTVTATLAALRSQGLDAERLPAAEKHPVLPRLCGHPGVLILDIDAGAGADAVSTASAGGWAVIVLGGDTDHERVAGAVAAGAAACVPKSAPFARLLDAVRGATTGAPLMADAERAEWLDLHRSTEAAVRDRVRRLERLSPRERDVLLHLVEGRRAAEIGAALSLSIATVRSHIRSILTKLDVRSQDQAVTVYAQTVRLRPDFAPPSTRQA